MGAHGLPDLEGDGLQRVQGRGRLLEDRADEASTHVVEHRAQGPHELDGLRGPGLSAVLAGLAGRAGVDDARRAGDGGGGREQTQGAQGGHRFPGAGLSHEGLDASGPKVQVDAGGGGSIGAGEGDAEAAQAQRRVVGDRYVSGLRLGALGLLAHEALTPITW